MRNKIGGQFLLDISMIALTFAEAEASISNAEILKQLNEFSAFIDPGRVYTKQSSKNVKPVTIRYRSSTKELDGVMYGQACFYDDALNVNISGSAVDSTGKIRIVIINVEYEFVDYVGYQVKTATITANSNIEADNIVRKIPAPESTTLTDDQIAAIMNGIFIDGTFLGLSNPVLLPLNESGGNYRGMYITGEKIGAFTINKTTKLISLTAATTLRIDLNSIGAINGKTLASYPESTGTFVLKCVDGVLTWVEETQQSAEE